MRLGGVAEPFPPYFEEGLMKLLDYLEKRLNDYEVFLEKNPVFIERTKGVGVLGRKEAIELGVTGPVLRASGVNFDTRRNFSYYAYEKLHFVTQVQTKGDSYARYKVRMLEMKESIKIIRDAFKKMPDGDELGLPIKLISPPIKNTEVFVKRELPRGEGYMYMIADKQRPYRLAIRAPAFVNLSALRYLAKGNRLADLFAILGSLDLVMADVDR